MSAAVKAKLAEIALSLTTVILMIQQESPSEDQLTTQTIAANFKLAAAQLEQLAATRATATQNPAVAG